MSQAETALNGFGLLCRSYRAELSMSLATFSDLLGVSLAEVSEFEAGLKLPSPTYIDRVCEILLLDETRKERLSRQSWLKSRTVRCLGYSAGKSNFVHRLLVGMNKMRVTEIESMSSAIRRYQE